ncbi:hypothetical protein C8J56DRAFT_934118 [Mycena floridula]|nr:hypothetical protein C8J56DRAFT_934118 [Mycena floridula]
MQDSAELGPGSISDDIAWLGKKLKLYQREFDQLRNENARLQQLNEIANCQIAQFEEATRQQEARHQQELAALTQERDALARRLERVRIAVLDESEASEGWATPTSVLDHLAPERVVEEPNARRWAVRLGQKLPQCSKGFRGPKPLTLEQLQRFLPDLGIRTIDSLDSLLLCPQDNPFGLVVEGDLAFVYSPVYVEEPQAAVTYLLVYGDSETHQALEGYIASQNHTVFHTFICPKSKSSWVYIGSQSWTVAQPPMNIWAVLEETTSRNNLIAHLGGQDAELVRRLDSGELSQFGIRLELDSLEVSTALVQDMLARSQEIRG